MSLQERTLVIKNFNPERTTDKLLKELCLQGGPVRNVVIRPDHAFVEFEDVESVGYSKALLEGVQLFGRSLTMEPKTREARYFKYTQALRDYIKYDKQQKAAMEAHQMMLNSNSFGQLGPGFQQNFSPLYQAPQLQVYQPPPDPQQYRSRSSNNFWARRR